jgi:glycosyltransferase involved in cell wall biosynthesis
VSCPLAVLAPQAGAASETFIQKHMQRLLPGATAAVVGHELADAYWQAPAPMLALDRVPTRSLLALARRAAARAGLPVDEPRRARVAAFLREHGVRAVLCEWLDWTVPWVDVIRSAGIRCVAHAHGYDVSERWLADPAVRERYRALTAVDALVVVSEATRARLAAVLPGPPIHVVPCGVDLPAPPAPRPAGDAVRCVAIGRLVAKKSPILLLDAFRRAHERVPELRLDLVGDGELAPAAADYVRAFALGGCVTLHGAVTHARALALLAEADVFLQHSVRDARSGDEEGLPVAVLEAMAHAVPVLATRHAGIPEAVADGVEGRLVEEGDSRAMAERLVELSGSPEVRRRLGEAGRATAARRFSWEAERATLLGLLGLGDL